MKGGGKKKQAAKAKTPGRAQNPGFVRTAFWVNLGLLLVALIGPRALANRAGASGVAAAMAFAAPMGVALMIGAGAAIVAWLRAQRDGLRMRWTAFGPLALVFAGMIGAFVYINN